MKHKIILFATLALISIIGVTACGQAAANAVPAAVVAAPTPDMAAYRALLDDARSALEKSDFAEAKSLAQEAARLNPADNTAFGILQEAAVGEAADDYLKNLPDRRYRIDTEHFLANKVNGEPYFILDVREADEYEAGHIDNAVHIPLRELTQHLDKLPESKSHPILVYCHTQKRATHALVVLRELGYTNVYNLEGGIKAYQEWTENNPTPTPGPTATFEPEGPSC